MVVTVISSAPMMMMTGPMAMCLQMFALSPGVTLRPEATLISSRHRVLPFFGIGRCWGVTRGRGPGPLIGVNITPGAGTAGAATHCINIAREARGGQIRLDNNMEKLKLNQPSLSCIATAGWKMSLITVPC